MARKPNSKQDLITIEDILEEISSFDATYAELLRNLSSKPIYKQLRGISEHQFFNATECSHSDDEELRRIKMQFAEINLLAMSADNIIDDVISEKFQSSFLAKLKEEVLKIILKLYADQASSSTKEKDVQSSQPVLNSRDSKKNKKNSENLQHKPKSSKSNGLSKNLNNEHSDVPVEHVENIESILTTIKREEDDDFGNLSFGSVSSVHTSDLSSFNDEISLPSDEETGKKGKRISFKMAEEEVIKLKAKRLKGENGKKEQFKEIKSDQDESNDDSSKSTQKFLPQRVRKPNSKYSEYVPTDALSPFKHKFVERSTSSKISASAQSPKTLPHTCESTTRKRGRPKKNP